MRTLTLLAGITLALACSSPAAAHTWTQGVAKAKPHAPSGPALGQKMIRQLQSEARVEVRGTERDPRGRTVHYLFRYQADARELIRETGGVLSNVQIGRGKTATLTYITVGRTLYKSVDGRRWARTLRSATASAADALRFNAASVSCCDASGTKARASLQYWGARTWNHTHVYRLHFARIANAVYIAGTVLIDARSFRPLQYSVTSTGPTVTGTFRFSYGGSFTISAPS